MYTTECPFCGEDVRIDDPRTQSHFLCSSCGVRVEYAPDRIVTKSAPIADPQGDRKAA